MSGKRGGASARRRETKAGLDHRQSSVGRSLALGAGILVLALVVLGVFSASREQEVTAATAPVQNADHVEVVYFHRTERCDSCTWAGQMSRKTVESYFAGELASGRVTFQEVDVQKPENQTLARKFRAAGSQLFINYVSQGKDNIREARQTYPYVGNQARFTEVLRKMIAAGTGGS